MRGQTGRGSGQVEDRRGMGGGGIGVFRKGFDGGDPNACEMFAGDI